MKVTFAEWGNYTIAFKTLLEKIGFDVIPPEKTNTKVIEEGAKFSPDLFCFPFKVNIGNYLPAIRKGADTVFMWENIGGSCRLRYYWIVQEKILREGGFNIKFINFNNRNILSRARELKKKNGLSYWKIINAAILFFREISFIDKVERRAHYFRPREKNRGETEKIVSQILADLENIKTLKGLSILSKKAITALSKIEVEKKREVLRAGVIGEIYTIADSAINFGLEKKLGEMGIEIHRKLNLTQHLLGGLFPWRERQLQKRVNGYLKSTVGGHGRQAIDEMLDFSKEKFDGVIHLLPFGCMPEITVRPMLQEISQKNSLPFLSISLDEQTSETGLQTRIEAFVDLLWSRRKNKIQSKKI